MASLFKIEYTVSLGVGDFRSLWRWWLEFQHSSFLNIEVAYSINGLQTQKIVFFDPPHDEFWISWSDIWRKGTWHGYLQAPKIYLVISRTYMVSTCWLKWPRAQKWYFQAILKSNIAENQAKMMILYIFLNVCFQDWKWNIHHKFDTSSCL